MKFGLTALLALDVPAAPALADTQPDHAADEYPYLAWRGEEVRLVKCEADVFQAITGQQAAQAIQFGTTFIDFLLVDWSR